MLTLREIEKLLYAHDDGYEDVTEAYKRLTFEEQCTTIALVGSDAGLVAFRDGKNTSKRIERSLMLCSMFEHLKVKRPSLLLLIDRLTSELASSDVDDDEELDMLRNVALAMLDLVMLVGSAESGPPMPISVPVAPDHARTLATALAFTGGARPH